jgi:hypothetical protein
MMQALRTVLVALALCLPAALGAADQTAINSICPVTGKPVDTTIPPVIVTLGKGERAQRMVIAVADRAAGDKVKANPAAYVEAARANRIAK